jgi:N-glycosylase/DNA lyase
MFLKLSEGGIIMAPTSAVISDMLNHLEEEDYRTAISFIEYLASSRKKKRVEESKNTLAEIQKMFVEDKGWDSEESMIEDMAAFRRERMNL